MWRRSYRRDDRAFERRRKGNVTTEDTEIAQRTQRKADGLPARCHLGAAGRGGRNHRDHRGDTETHRERQMICLRSSAFLCVLCAISVSSVVTFPSSLRSDDGKRGHEDPVLRSFLWLSL